MSKPYRDYVGDPPLEPPDRGDDFVCFYCGDVKSCDDQAPDEAQDEPCCWTCKRELEA
jgi:hypothetical protein